MFLKASIFSLFAAVLLAAGCGESSSPSASMDSARSLARTISIIHNSTAEHPRVLKVLFYGQSISTPKWTDKALTSLRSVYPNVAFDARNLAIGGFDASKLQWAAARDVQEFYPDLIVFHVYGDHRAYERIIRVFRSLTAADIVVSTDHVTQPVEPVCDRGLKLRYSPPPGCTGHFWFKQNVWEQFMSSVWLPEMSRKYNLAVEPRRERWNNYLQEHGIPANSLLEDTVHPNERGWQLMSELFVTWFRSVVDSSEDTHDGDRGRIQSIPSPGPGSSQSIFFVGNRIELLATGPLKGHLKATIDGKSPEELDGCWQDSRTTRLPTVTDWPAIRRIVVDPGYHHSDTWTVRVSRLNPEQDEFDFTISSKSGGADGSGKGSKPFISNTGRVSISPPDWVLPYAAALSGKGVPEGYEIQWHRSFVCTDQSPVVFGNGAVEQRHVLATGLQNTRHELKLTIGKGAPEIREVRAYRPALQ